ncbi:MAG: HlyD family secretion protein [Bacteroidota bacterium]
MKIISFQKIFVNFSLAAFLLLLGCSNKNTNEIKGSGTLEATEVSISAKVQGEILKLFVDEGSRVKEGDTLAIIDHADFDIQLNQAKANLAASEAQYQLSVKGSRSEDIAQAEATLKNSKDDLERMKVLLASNSITQKQYDDVVTRNIVAQQTYDKLHSGSRPEEIETARARRNQASAQVDAIQKKIRDSYVLSPMNGIVTLKMFERGETVSPNASMFRITEADRIHLMVYVSESDLARIKLGQEAKVSIDGAPGKAFPGTVVFTSPVAEFTPKNIQTQDERTKLVFGIKIEMSNPTQELKPGMPADAVISISG